MVGGSVPRVAERAGVATVVLALAAFPLLRPNILGERFTAWGLALVVGAAFLVVVESRGRTRWSRPAGIMIVLLGAAHLWALFRVPYNGVGIVASIVGTVSILIAVSAFAYVLAEPGRAVLFVRGLLLIIAVMSVSSVVTLAMVVLGLPLAMFSFPITPDVSATTFFPFTVTSGAQFVFGVEIPRFTGLGREPGWMAMYGAVAWLLWPRVFGRRLRVLRAMLIVGILATLSTAGFGIFVVVAAFDLFLRPRPRAGLTAGYFRQLFGVIVFGMAIWLAVTAPVVGLEAKTTQNAASLSERNAATLDGLRALQQFSLGEESDSRIPGVNLVAAVAETGWPYSLLIALAILLPLAVLPSRRDVAPIAVVFLTLLLAQPPGESTTVFVLVLACCAVAALPHPRPPAAQTVAPPRPGASVPVYAAGRRWPYAVVVASMVAVVALSAFALVPREVPAAAATKAPATVDDFARPVAPPTVAVFVGDSYTAGAGSERGGFVPIVARGREWQAINLGRGGTGFVTKPGQDPAQAQVACGSDYCESYIEMIPAAVEADPDVVFVSGGRNDVGTDPALAADAVEEFFDALRAGLPDARLIVLSPLWDSDEPPSELALLATAVRSSALAVGAEYVDIGQPLQGRLDYISDDGVHPDDAGYAAIATAVSAALNAISPVGASAAG
ncbi:SGNH/GDSL hydrolase family protein [Planococcus sp. APC 4015]|nr:SGNH/GDSL hydrolase family protein [Planococcus sp. APC 4015]